MRRENIYGYWQYDDTIPMGNGHFSVEKNDILYVISKKGFTVYALHDGEIISLDITHIQKACSRPRRGHAPVNCNEKTKEVWDVNGTCDKCRTYLNKRKCVNGTKVR